MKQYATLTITIQQQVATIAMNPQAEDSKPSGGNLHWDLGEVFSELRGDNNVRVIVITGAGKQFLTGRSRKFYQSPQGQKSHTSPRDAWLTFTGVARMHEAMAEIEKPIVARVNGDANGFGSSLVFASDIIVAKEDAQIVDSHMGMGEIGDIGADFGLVPGDGGGALVPLFMPPTLAKEYLMLLRPFTGKELCAYGIVNYAVPASELDATVESIVSRLLRRSSYALAWTKRVANRLVADQLARSLDASMAYEMINFLQRGDSGSRHHETLG